MNIGCIGLGNMGGGIARNLLAYCKTHGHRLLVFDVSPVAVQPLTELGATQSDSVSELAAQVEVLFTSLPGATQINELAFGGDGILKNLPTNAVWFETSTNEIPAWQKIVATADDHLTLVDAPVTGGSEGAATGTLTILLGIDEKTFAKHRELLAAISSEAVRMGESGAGYVTKLCQLHLNYLAAHGIGEAMMLAAKSGLDLTLLHRVLMKSCAQSYVVDRYIPKVLDGSYDPSFALGLATRDMRLINELGAHLGVELRIADEVYSQYKQACENYGEDAPHLSNLRLIETKCGQLLRD